MSVKYWFHYIDDTKFLLFVMSYFFYSYRVSGTKQRFNQLHKHTVSKVRLYNNDINFVILCYSYQLFQRLLVVPSPYTASIRYVQLSVKHLYYSVPSFVLTTPTGVNR